MTLASTQNKVTYFGNGVVTTFDYPFRIIRAEDLTVTLTEVDSGRETVLTGGYTVNGAGQPNGGTVTYPTFGPPLTSGQKITLRRVLRLVQDTAISNQGGYFPAVHETVFDRQTMIAQQQQEEIGRALKIPVSDLPNGVTLPPMNTRANRVLAFDGAGGVTVSSFTLQQIESGASTELSAQDAQNAAVEADAARDVVLINKADFDPKYADFSGKYADFAPKYSLFTPAYADFAAKYADFVPKHTIAQAQWPTVQMAGKWAEEAEDVEVLPGQYSAKHWARKSAAVVLGGTTVISSNDKVPDFLGNKLLAGNGIALGVAAAGSAQTMTVSNTAVPKFYTRASAALAQNASLTLATPGVKDGEGLKRVVSVFEETVGTALTDSATDFDMADEAQFAFRSYTPNTAITLTGGESVGRTELRASPSAYVSKVVPLTADGSKALVVYHDGSTGYCAAVATRLVAGSYSIGPGTLVFGTTETNRTLAVCAFGAGNVLVAITNATTLPMNWIGKCVSVGAGDVITVGAQAVIRSSGTNYGTTMLKLARLSDTSIAVVGVDTQTGSPLVESMVIGRVTLSGTTLSVGAWLTAHTQADNSSFVLHAIAVLGSGVLAVCYGLGTEASRLRLFDMSTAPATAGGAYASTFGYGYTPVALLKLAADRFSVIAKSNTATLSHVFSYSGTATPTALSSLTTLAANAAVPYDASIVEYAPYRHVIVGWDTGVQTAYRLTYVAVSLSGTNTVQVDSIQQLAVGAGDPRYGSNAPMSAHLAPDGYVWASCYDYTAGKIVSFEYRPFSTAVIASGAWAAEDVGRAVIAANGVGRIDSINGATASLMLLDAFDTTGTFTAGNWSLRDAALYDGKVQTVKPVPAVVRTTKDSSLWEALTGLSASVSGAVKLAWSFDGRSWSVWDGSARRIIVTNRASIHGGIDPQWMVRNDADSWVFPPENNAQSALETAFSYTANQTAPAVYAALGAAGFAALGFTKSMTGTVRVGMWLPPGGSFDQLTLNYTGRSAWKRAESGYSIDYGREDQVVITRTASGTASVFATVMHVETT